MTIRKTTISSRGKQQNNFRQTKRISIKAKEEKKKKQKNKNINMHLNKCIKYFYSDTYKALGKK